MKNKKGFQLSINMLVVIILGLAMLGIGVSLFSQAFVKTVEMRENVDSQTQAQLDALLTDEDARVIIPQTTKSVKRGDYVDFNLGVVNELSQTETFFVCYEYMGSTAYPPDGEYADPFMEVDDPRTGATLGDSWFLIVSQEYELLNNEREYVPIRIDVPKKNVLRGQYIFNVMVGFKDPELNIDDSIVCARLKGDTQYGVNQYGSTQKLYVKVE